MSEYTAIIPVAGKGVRLLPYTAHCPKTMLHVAGRPIISHILEQVEACGIRRVVFIVGYQKEVFIEYIRSHYSQLEVSFVEQAEQKGLGHAISLARDQVTGPCFIVLGDTIIDGELKPLMIPGGNCVAVKVIEDPRRFGVVEMKDGRVCGFEEKPEHPKSKLALIGAYAFADSAQLFAALDEVIASGKTVKNEIQLTDALSVLVKHGVEIKPVLLRNWFDCGTIEILLQTNHVLLERHTQIPANLSIENEIIGPCWIDKTAQLKNCKIGPYVSIAEGAVLKNCVLTEAVVSADTQLENITAQHQIFDKYSVN